MPLIHYPALRLLLLASINMQQRYAKHGLSNSNIYYIDVAGVMALLLAEKDYTPDELSDYLKDISTLVSNQRGLTTVIDNSASQGPLVDNSNTVTSASDFNIVYTNPSNNQQWIIFQGISRASSSIQPHSPFILLASAFLLFLVFNLQFMNCLHHILHL